MSNIINNNKNKKTIFQLLKIIKPNSKSQIKKI